MSPTPNQNAINTLTVAPLLIVDPLLRRLYQYWDRERGSRSIPTRDSVDPIKMRYILGHVALIDVIGNRRGFRVRLHGTELVAHLGADFTGKTIDDLPLADARELAAGWFTAVAEQHAPYHEQIDQVVDGFARHFETLILPYTSQRTTAIDLMLLAIRCRSATPALSISEPRD